MCRRCLHHLEDSALVFEIWGLRIDPYTIYAAALNMRTRSMDFFPDFWQVPAVSAITMIATINARRRVGSTWDHHESTEVRIRLLRQWGDPIESDTARGLNLTGRVGLRWPYAGPVSGR